MKVGHWPVGVCTWSLQMPIEESARTLDSMDVGHVHLAVGPAIEEGGEEYLKVVREQDWNITATMVDFPQEDYSSLESIKRTGGIVPNEHWEANRQRFINAVDVTAQLGVRFLSMHPGFLTFSNPEETARVKKRIQTLADISAKQGVTLLLETGQETAREMQKFLIELNHPGVGVNFDPANMILYGKGDPVMAVHTLSSWIAHIHIKDAVYADEPGIWGEEVPWGEGEVDAHSFLNALRAIGYIGALAIEREAGNDRISDITFALRRLQDATDNLKT